MLGELINGKYKIESAFSESRMYEVFTATEVNTETTVVVKLMKPEIITNTGIVNSFCKEIKAFASLSNPYIAEVLDIDMYEGRPYMVSPLVKGTPLNELLQDEVIPFKECLNIIQGLGTVLQYAYDQKIECRTIKLSNVLKTDDGKIKLLSFTQPRLRSVSSVVSKGEGTGLYSDLYFLGITLYELLAGESPIRVRGGLYELWDMKLEQFLRIRHIDDMKPEQVEKIVDFIRKTISRDEKIRFKSHAEYLEALDELNSDERKKNVNKKTAKHQLCIASQVVDALNGVSNVIPSMPSLGSSKKATQSKVAVASLNANSKSTNKTELQIGTSEFKTEGTLALAVDNSDKFDLEKNRPIQTKSNRANLKVVKSRSSINNLPTKKEKISKKEEEALEWQDEGLTIKSPVVYVGFLLVVMVALILFW